MTIRYRRQPLPPATVAAVSDLLVPAPDPEPGVDYLSHQIVDRLFDAAECADIIGLADTYADEASTVGSDDEGTEISEVRSATTTWMPVTDATVRWVVDRLAEAVTETNRVWQLDLVGFAEDLQLATYDRVGDFYTWHQDGLDGGVADRKLAVVVQLSDPATYEGADLEIFDVNVDLDSIGTDDWLDQTSQLGTAVVFPAWEYHRVTELRSGERKSLVAWISGPPVR